MRLFTIKLLVVSVVASALMLVGAGAALADSASTTSGVVASINVEPDTATVGELVSVDASIANNGPDAQLALVKLSLKTPFSFSMYSVSKYVLLAPGANYALDYSFTVPWFLPAGQYAAKLTVSAGGETISVEDAITITK